MIDIVLVGASGYGSYYIGVFRDEPGMDARICAVIDPFAASSPHLAWLREKEIPVYERLEDFYAEGGRAGLAVISSPIQFHKQQAMTAMRHGSAVLCEKPLCACAADAYELLREWETLRVPFGVGFQWSFSPVMAELKRDILAGELGAPLCMKTLVSWPRGDKYFDPGGWKGKRTDAAGNAVNDSVAMNATAHYLHNMLFMLGDRMEAAACPTALSGSLSRARDIGTFDTCFLRAGFANGCEALFCASHVAGRTIEPCFEYRFENASVTFDDNADGVVRAEFSNGRVKEYGSPQTEEMIRSKLRAMVDAARTGDSPVCGIRSAIPHLLVCDAILGGLGIKDVPDGLIIRDEARGGLFVRGLDDEMEIFYKTGNAAGMGADSIMPLERSVEIRPPA